MNLKAPIPHYVKAVEHRILRRRVWKWFQQGRARTMTDGEFLSLLGGKTPEVQTLDALHAALRSRLFFHPRNRKEFFSHLITQGQPSDSVLEDGQAVLDGKFQTLGSDLVSLGEPINWQKDFKSGYTWPMQPSHTLDVLMQDQPTDVKVPWELGRFHQNWWLGKAYWISAHEGFAKGFRHLVEDWIDQNPPGLGVQWSLAMEAAIRAMNWICGYSFFCESKALPPEFWVKFFKSLYIHGLFIWNNREYALRNGNHYLSNVVGLLFLGVVFRQTRAGRRWLSWSRRALEFEMQQEVTPDGVNYEKSTSYHRLVLELFTAGAVLCQINSIDLDASFWSRLEKMFEFVLAYSRPDGSVPMIGDADDGRLFRLRLSEPINDHRHLLSIGAVLFRRGDFKDAALSYSQDALFLLGAEGFERFLQIQAVDRPPESCRFVEGGFVIMRTPDLHLLVDVGDIGMKGRGGHGHNDTLSFDLWARGVPLVVDPGTYVYTADVTARQLFRSTRMHNTVMVAGKEIAEFSGLWQIAQDTTDVRVLRWKSDARMDLLVASHSAYQRLPVPVVHERTITLDKETLSLEVADRLHATGSTSAELFFHLHPGVRVEASGEARWILRAGDLRVTLMCSHRLVQQESWFSPSYGLRTPSTSLCVPLSLSADTHVQTQFIFS